MDQEQDQKRLSTLTTILDGNHDDVLNLNLSKNALAAVADQYGDEEAMSIGSGDDTETTRPKAPDGYCVECEGKIETVSIEYLDQPAEVFCEQCQDDFCAVCYMSQHRKGTRKKHTTKKIAKKSTAVMDEGSSDVLAETEHDSGVKMMSTEALQASELVKELDFSENTADVGIPLKGNFGDWFLLRSKCIPLRMTLQERKYLRLLEAALNVSEYTDKIDVLVYSNKTRRMVAQIRELCSILSGLVLAADYKIGQELFKNKDFEENAEFFQDIFELGRRHKIMNPEKMRDTYGKLLYMLQDSQLTEVQEMLQFKCVKPIRTVYKVLEERKGLAILEDELIVPATQEIIATGKARNTIQYEIKQKERAIELLSRKYARADELSADLIKQCLYSIGDNHAFLRTNRDPCDQMIAYLKRYFNADKPEPEFSLAIYAGKAGARLSHDHSKQYSYVLQSLSLWREIQHEMFQLWCLADDDLLSADNFYRLRDTGQGLNRVQAAPKVGRMMQTILTRAQQKVGYWVGSSVVHLGDHNVPNALMFIDKYTQIYRILLPIVNAIEKLEEAYKDQGIRKYMDSSFGGLETARKSILCDFFKYGFDGSGADNFFDAGSCIDGRLTSAWNWCSKLEKKLYFPLFLLTGFVGFDGQF